MTNKRISDLSCKKVGFYKVKSVSQSVLKDSGHCSLMSYNNSNTQNARRNRNRKVIWFNPPYSQNVKTNIGKLFIKLVRKHFSKNSKYHMILNLNTLKLSCTINVGNIINQHNSKVLKKTNGKINRKWNCRSKPNCSLNGECLPQCLVYKATSTTFSNSFVYYGTSEEEFKSRYNNHTKSFRHRECMNETELSNHVWNVKDHDNNLSQEIHKKASPHQCNSKRCDLCMSEKFSIICADPDTLRNKRTELISKCRHRNKILLVRNIR